MERENDWDSDFCDLEPGKICDNCCRCLDMDRDYNEIEASLLRTDEIVSIGDWDAEADAYIILKLGKTLKNRSMKKSNPFKSTQP